MPIEVKMPRLSDTMEVGTVVKWNVKPGQKVSSGDVIADIETDKATMELQSFDDGVVASLPVPEGQSVKVGTVIMVLAAAGEEAGASTGAGGGGARASGDVSQQENEKGVPTAIVSSKPEAVSPTPAAQGAPARDKHGPGITAPPTGAPAPGARGPVAPEPPAGAPGGDHAEVNGVRAGRGERVFASPLARKVAAERGIDLGGVRGTGPGGRVVRRDVEAAAAGGSGGVTREPGARGTGPGGLATPVPSRPVFQGDTSLEGRVVPLSNMRRVIAARLVESKTTIPHYQVTVTARLDALQALRAQLNGQLAPQGVKLSVNDFLVRACALAMHQHPFVNSRWAGAKGQEAIEVIGAVNVGVAIALPEERGGGLVVATVRAADQKGLRQISAETRGLAEKARTRGLTLEEMSDSTFTISNLGMFGVDHFTAIINPPNTAILAVGAAIERPVVETGPDGAKRLGIGVEMSMTMSSDHRVIDGAMAAQYLGTVKQMLETPATLLV